MATGVQVMVRMSAALKAAIDKAAAQNQTSISGEVSHRLKRTLLEDEQRGGSNSACWRASMRRRCMGASSAPPPTMWIPQTGRAIRWRVAWRVPR